MKKKIILGILLTFVLMVAGTLALSIRPDYSGINYNPADSQNETDKTIKFGEDGKLKILHIPDTHLKHNHNLEPTIWMVEEACDKENPDIVMLTGDIVLNCETEEDTKKQNFILKVYYDSCLSISDNCFDDSEELIYPIEDIFFSEDDNIL